MAAPDAGIRRVVGPDATPPIQGKAYVSRRDLPTAERRRIRAAPIGDGDEDEFFNPLFYDEDEVLSQPAESETDEAYLDKRRDTESRFVNMYKSRREAHKSLQGHGTGVKEEEGVPMTAWLVRRMAVAERNIHMLDIVNVRERVHVMETDAWRVVNAELTALYIGARVVGGGMPDLVWRMASAGAYIGRRKHVVALTDTAQAERKHRFDDVNELLKWARAGHYESRYGQEVDMYTFTIDSRIDLGVSIVVVRLGGSGAVVVVGFAYWCLRNPLTELLERHTHTPPIPASSKSVHEQIWNMGCVRGGVRVGDRKIEQPFDLAPGWQTLLCVVPDTSQQAHTSAAPVGYRVVNDRDITFRLPRNGV